MPSPKDKKLANVNISMFSNSNDTNIDNKKEQQPNPSKPVPLPDWVKQYKQEKGNSYKPDVSKDEETAAAAKAAKAATAAPKTKDILEFDSTSKSQQSVNDAAQTAVDKSVRGESFSADEQKDATDKFAALEKKYNDKYMQALAENQPDKFSTIASIMSALVTAATGGAIPFIPFNAITGNDQKIAYYNKLKATYANNMQDLTTDVQSLEQKRDKEATATDETIQNAKTMAKEEGARNTAENAYMANIEQTFTKEMSKLNQEQKKELMTVAKNLENKSMSEQIKYLSECANDPSIDSKTRDTIAYLVSAIEAGRTSGQIKSDVANTYSQVFNNAIKGVGGLLPWN